MNFTLSDNSFFFLAKKKPTRKCEVLFPYSPVNEDEMELVAGETIEIVREVQFLSPLWFSHLYLASKYQTVSQMLAVDYGLKITRLWLVKRNLCDDMIVNT